MNGLARFCNENLDSVFPYDRNIRCTKRQVKNAARYARPNGLRFLRWHMLSWHRPRAVDVPDLLSAFRALLEVI